MRFILPGSTKFTVLTCFTTGQRNWTSPPPKGETPLFFIYWEMIRECCATTTSHYLTRSSNPSDMPNSSRWGRVAVLRRSTFQVKTNLSPILTKRNQKRTDKSLSSVVIPLIVRCTGFLANGANIITGSRKYPRERESGQSWVKFPPEITPGLRRIDVPDRNGHIDGC